MWHQGTVPSGSTVELAAQLHTRDAQLAEASQQLEATRFEIAALTEDAARREEQLQASRAKTTELTRQVHLLQNRISWVLRCAPPATTDPAPLLAHVLHRLDPLTAPCFPLLDLPDIAIHLVLDKAGPPLRLACKRLLHASGPALHLRPMTLPDDDVDGTATMAALLHPSRLQHLTSLDLEAVPCAMIDDFLPACVPLCPNLRLLRLGEHRRVSLPAIATLTALGATLEGLALSVPYARKAKGRAMASFMEGTIAHLTRLRGLSLMLYTCPKECMLQALSNLQRLTRLELRMPLPWLCGTSYMLQPVAAIAPALVHLELPRFSAWDEASVAMLSSLASLTSLSFGCYVQSAAVVPLLLAAVAALPGLRQLNLQDATKWALPHLGRLSPLRLEALRVSHPRKHDESNDPYEDLAGDDGYVRYAGSDMLAGVGAHGTLTRLHVVGAITGVAITLQGRHFAAVQALAASLQTLDLYGVLLPLDVLQLLRGFPLLRTLAFERCRHLRGEAVDGGEHFRGDEGLSCLPCEGLSRLSQLRSLTLHIETWGADQLARLLEEVVCLTALTRLELFASAVGQLVTEDLWKLVGMQRLEELAWGVEVLTPVAWAVLQHMPALRKFTSVEGTCGAAELLRKAACCVDELHTL